MAGQPEAMQRALGGWGGAAVTAKEASQERGEGPEKARLLYT